MVLLPEMNLIVTVGVAAQIVLYEPLKRAIIHSDSDGLDPKTSHNSALTLP
jgi:hypothetical protein